MSIDVTFPDWGNKSASLVLENTYRAIFEFLSDHRDRQVDTIYLTYDNVSSNKSFTLLCGLCALVLLGVCRKVKITYLITCHTHQDESSSMGVTSQHFGLGHKNLMSFEAWKQMLIEAVRMCRNDRNGALVESTISKVSVLLHFPDYVGIFKDVNFNSDMLNGVGRVHQYRIVGKPGTETCEIHYKEDIRVNGYFPRATQPTQMCSEQWKRLFVHRDGRQGYPEKVECQGTDRVAGQRQSWRYDVTFAGGAEESYFLKGEGLPHNLCRRDILTILEKPLPHFPLSGFDLRSMQETWERVKKLIRVRGSDEDLERMALLYEDFPVSVDDERYTSPIPNSTLLKLFQEFGGDMRFKSYDMHRPRIAGCQIVDAITWKGSELTSAQRDQVLADAEAKDPDGVQFLPGVRMRRRVNKKLVQSKGDTNIKNKTSDSLAKVEIPKRQKVDAAPANSAKSKYYIVSIK